MTPPSFCVCLGGVTFTNFLESIYALNSGVINGVGGEDYCMMRYLNTKKAFNDSRPGC